MHSKNLGRKLFPLSHQGYSFLLIMARDFASSHVFFPTSADTMNNASQKELATAEYWEKRYADNSDTKADGTHEVDNYEWFKTYDKLKPFLHKHLPPAFSKPRILHLGCGTSVGVPEAWQGRY